MIGATRMKGYFETWLKEDICRLEDKYKTFSEKKRRAWEGLLTIPGSRYHSVLAGDSYSFTVGWVTWVDGEEFEFIVNTGSNYGTMKLTKEDVRRCQARGRLTWITITG